MRSLDEAQLIKNPMSATAKAAKKLKAHRRLALTGTPIENRLSEIWSIFDFVAPGLLGDLARFEQRYSTPIDRGDSKAAARLRAAIHPFTLRRTKEEVAKDLPEKIDIEQSVELAPEQQKLYGQVLQEVRASVLGEIDKVGVAKAQIQILAALTRLRQVACDPRLLGLPRAFTDDDSGKVAALRELVQQAYAGGHRALVFSQFTSMLALIKKAMDEDGIKYEYLDGSTKDRMERVERFNNDPTVTVFLISLKAGGMGLNLTGADTVVHFDPWWKPGRRRPSDRPRPPHRSDPRRHRLQAGRQRHHRREDPPARRKEARPRRRSPHRRRRRRQEAHASRHRRPLRLNVFASCTGWSQGRRDCSVEEALRHRALVADGCRTLTVRGAFAPPTPPSRSALRVRVAGATRTPALRLVSPRACVA